MDQLYIELLAFLDILDRIKENHIETRIPFLYKRYLFLIFFKKKVFFIRIIYIIDYVTKMKWRKKK